MLWKHICNIASSIIQKFGIVCKCCKVLSNNGYVLKPSHAFILPYLKYGFPVGRSAADSNLKLLDYAFNNIKFCLPNILINIACLSMLYMILHTVVSLSLQTYKFSNPIRFIGHTVQMHDKNFYWIGIIIFNYLIVLPILLLNSWIVYKMRLFY